MTPLLDIEGLEVDIPLDTGVLHAVRGIALKIAAGETVGIVGESGCGKSLTALSIMGLLPHRARVRSQRFRFDGEDLAGADDTRYMAIRGAKIGMIFQEPMTALNPTLTIGLQLTEVHTRHRGSSVSEARERALYLLQRVGISDPPARLRQYPHELSGGLRQRIMIAMALMCGPKLLVADEPTTALDVTIQAQILHLLKELKDETRTSLLIISHDLGVVSRIADRVLVMYAGEVVEEGPRRAIFRNPMHPYTGGLFECLPQSGRTRRGKHLGSIPGMVPSLVGTVTGCSFRNRCRIVTESCGGKIPIFAKGDHRTLCLRPGAFFERNEHV